MAFHFSIIGLKVEFSNADITQSISTLLPRLMRVILWFIFFIYRHEKLFLLLLFLTAFTCSLGLLLPDSTILMAGNLSLCQNSKLLLRYLEMSTRCSICCRNPLCETPKLFCARQGFMGKMFFTFYFKTCSDTGMICVYDVMFFSLRFNVLLPENYLFFSELVIRYIKMQI